MTFYRTRADCDASTNGNATGFSGLTVNGSTGAANIYLRNSVGSENMNLTLTSAVSSPILQGVSTTLTVQVPSND